MSRLQRLVLPLCFALALAACQSEEERLETHMSRGDEYREQEQWAEAIIEYRNVLQIDPNHAAAHWAVAQAYLQNKQARDGFWELREAVRLDPDNFEAKVALAQMMIYADEVEESIKLADEVIAARPGDPEAYLVRAQGLDRLKRPEEVLETLEQAVEVAPESDAALAFLANVHRRNGNREAAEPLYRKRVEAKPSYATWAALASFLSEDRERTDEAEATWKKVVEVAEGEDIGRAHAQLAGFFFRLDRFDEAEAVLRKGIDSQEDKLEMIYLLARFHTLRGDQAKAEALIESATDADPENPRPYLILSAYRGRQGDSEGALQAAEDAVRAAPDDDRARLRKAEVLVEIGYREGDDQKIAEGRRVAEAVLAEEPTNSGALFVKAKIEMAEKRVEDAITSLRKAIDARPGWAQAHFVLGTALAISGEQTAARTELARALEIDASLTEAHQVLAQVHAGLGEHEYAVEEGRLFLRERPDAIPVRVLVAQSLLRLGRIEEAMKELNSVPEEERSEEVHFALGKILLAQGKLEEARVELEAADALVPNNPDVIAALLTLDQRDKKLDESIARIAAAMKEEPESAPLQRIQGQAMLAKGDGDAAEAAFRRAIELDPNDVQSYRLLATYYQLTGRLQETIETFEKAVEVEPDASHIHHFLGMLYEGSGQRKKSIEHYEAAIRANPSLAEAKNNLAYMFAEGDENLERALDLAQEAKALLPNNPNAADTLGWVLFKRGVPSAAITYLREAEGGFETSLREAESGLSSARNLASAHISLGVVRLHLAKAYEADGQKEAARSALERALADFEAFKEAQREKGSQLRDDPGWVATAKDLLATL